jgi:2OG-Fe(II) oxygenase superfamily
MRRIGQVFLPHQDSEKDDAMAGTLVASLPSAHTGGELVVEHGGQSVTYRAPTEDLSFVAFYADCRHEVRPVKSGYRVTLTFDLLPDLGGRPGVPLPRCIVGRGDERLMRKLGSADGETAMTCGSL